MPEEPSGLTSSDVSAGDDINATDHNQIRADIINRSLPPHFSIVQELLTGAFGLEVGRIGNYSDDIRYIPTHNGGTFFLAYDLRAGGGNTHQRNATSDWADMDVIVGTAKIGDYLYVGMRDNGATEHRVYRYDADDISSGGTLMTVSGTALGNTTNITVMVCDGDSLWFNNEAGDTASSNHIFRKYTISGTTLTSSTTTTNGSTSANFAQAAMDHSGNFYGFNTGDSKARRYNTSGTLQDTQNNAYTTVGNGFGLSHTFEGIPFMAFETGASGQEVIHFMRIPLLA